MVLDSFKDWLQGLDGGDRELRTAKQYVSQISAIISQIDPVQQSVSCILNKKDLRDKWLEKMKKNKKPGTCKSYLGSLARFLRFVIVERPQSLEGYAEQAAEIREQVQEWQAAFRVAVNERHWEKLMEDLDKLIESEDVQKFA